MGAYASAYLTHEAWHSVCWSARSRRSVDRSHTHGQFHYDAVRNLLLYYWLPDARAEAQLDTQSELCLDRDRAQVSRHNC